MEPWLRNIGRNKCGGPKGDCKCDAHVKCLERGCIRAASFSLVVPAPAAVVPSNNHEEQQIKASFSLTLVGACTIEKFSMLRFWCFCEKHRLQIAVRFAALDALCEAAGQRANPLSRLGFYKMARMMWTLSHEACPDGSGFDEDAEEALLDWMAADNHWLLFPGCIGGSNTNNSRDHAGCEIEGNGDVDGDGDYYDNNDDDDADGHDDGDGDSSDDDPFAAAAPAASGGNDAVPKRYRENLADVEAWIAGAMLDGGAISQLLSLSSGSEPLLEQVACHLAVHVVMDTTFSSQEFDTVATAIARSMRPGTSAMVVDTKRMMKRMAQLIERQQPPRISNNAAGNNQRCRWYIASSEAAAEELADELRSMQEEHTSDATDFVALVKRALSSASRRPDAGERVARADVVRCVAEHSGKDRPVVRTKIESILASDAELRAAVKPSVDETDGYLYYVFTASFKRQHAGKQDAELDDWWKAHDAAQAPNLSPAEFLARCKLKLKQAIQNEAAELKSTRKTDTTPRAIFQRYFALCKDDKTLQRDRSSSGAAASDEAFFTVSSNGTVIDLQTPLQRFWSESFTICFDKVAGVRVGRAGPPVLLRLHAREAARQ